ncbi:MAG: hypothetical protein OEW49_00350 [Nitrosopumilus sp.]|nr:hypothetical protein [Nitrosopumilus sp.]
MLAYELFHNNNDSTTNNPKKQFPIKKIFYQKGKITIDKTTLEDYGSADTEATRSLQNWLVMPLNTIDVKELNLPDYRTGTAGANPYIEIYGYLKTNKSLESKLSLSIGKKPNYIEHVLDLASNKIQSNSNGKIILKLDQKNYFLKSHPLISEYVASGIIDEKGILNAKVYDEIIQEFLDFAKKQESNFTKIGNNSFRIYILPDSSTIEFKKESKKNDSEQESFLDYFGNPVTNYASTPTKTAKFLSSDDKAFTINCKQGMDFYKNLGIGNASLEKIYTDPSQTFNINRLDWTFTDISDPDFKFVETRKGILTQIYENYLLLSKDKGTRSMAQLKTICIRINQAKQELLIDENLTMNKMKEMFSNIKDIPPLCFEKVLIDTSGQNPIWSTYLYVVKNFLAGNKIPKSYLLSFFNKTLKQKRYDWVKSKNKSEQNDFFLRTDFCLKYLSTTKDTQSYMDQNEEFAEKIGQIARTYIEFKQRNAEIDNSLSDILTYSKYDRERLRFIVSRIGRGVQLSKVSEDVKKEITKKISSLQPSKEIEDDYSSKDYSYFFFKGYYTNLEIAT